MTNIYERMVQPKYRDGDMWDWTDHEGKKWSWINNVKCCEFWLQKHLPHAPGDTITCKGCQGSGVAWDNGSYICPTCKGSGELTVVSVTPEEVFCQTICESISCLDEHNCDTGKVWRWRIEVEAA